MVHLAIYVHEHTLRNMLIRGAKYNDNKIFLLSQNNYPQNTRMFQRQIQYVELRNLSGTAILNAVSQYYQ